MNKFIIFAVLMTVACASAKPDPSVPLAFSAPLVAAAPLPYVAASSSQVIARNYNGLAVAAPFVAAPAPLIASAPAVVSPYAYPYSAYNGYPFGYSVL